MNIFIKNLLPASRTFWLYHLSGCLLVVLSYFLMHSYYGNNVFNLTVMNVIGMGLFTPTALCFRRCYIKYRWQDFNTAKIISLVFIYSALAGLLVAVLLTLATKSFYLDPQLARVGPDKAVKVILSQLVFLAFTYQVIACGWGFIYNYTVASRRVQAALLNNLRLQNSLKDAQLSSLSNQLNPHFLFNSLNNIRFVIHENQQKADDMITNLSELLRYSLETSQHEKVELQQELAIIEQFIELESIQLEQRLNFKLHDDSRCGYYLVPPMTIHLLVENAIKHGIELLPEGGTLSLDITVLKQQLVFTVTNDKPLSYQVLKPGTKIGLDNIRQRLRLLYGDQASLEVDNGETVFIAKMIIPREASHESYRD
ncbi:histidine kinase [Thalassomonas sp. RHCl1]|uniref:sensor histidine kinase n=1 Tax=Thalassomonas sp. RHCl1 TaxID=2995320 RepID=UPI00248D3798|nr:histidine kinase [Thalassomonas sp. RHCl1]